MWQKYNNRRNIYRPPNNKIDEFKNKINQILGKIDKKKKKAI